VSVTLWVAGLVIPGLVLLVDLGRRRLTTMRILRPFIGTAIVIPFVMPGLDLHGTGLALEAAGCAAGVALGFLTAAAMRVEHDHGQDEAFTIAGAVYAAIWICFCAARLGFAYESSHSASFGRAVGQFLVGNHITVTALADAIMFLSLAMLIGNRGTLFVRARSARARTPIPSPAKLADTARL
jgi:hypothetical protein